MFKKSTCELQIADFHKADELYKKERIAIEVSNGNEYNTVDEKEGINSDRT